MIVINSFNDFENDSQIYPVTGRSIASPLTDRQVYEAYGETYLELLTDQFGSYVSNSEIPVTSPSTMAPTQAPVEQVPVELPDWCDIDGTEWP